jgi:oligopeptide/dipeptide ABC transporter ATP-binding protein
MDNKELILDVRNLQVKFKVAKDKTLTAIEDVSFKVNRGETLGIVGESGCGKSVTANTILRLLPQQTTIISNGEILLGDVDLVKLSDKEMRSIRGNRISMIFQEPMTALNPVYRIGDQLIEMLRANGTYTKKEARQKSVEMLKKVGIHDPEMRMKEFPHQLSGGMRQRVMIAMALSTDPELLIADEPTTALDVTIQAQVLELMKSLQSTMNTAIMLITHDMGVIAENADYVLVMYAGEVVENADVETIFKDAQHPYTKGLLSSLLRVDRDSDKLNTIEGTVPALDDMPTGCRFSTRCTYCTERCKTEKPEMYGDDSHKVRCFLYQNVTG